MSLRVVPLPTGADARLRNEGSRLAVVLVNGGTARAVPGTWSATSELLADELAPRAPGVTLIEVRYRIKTWNELPSCVADARAALDLAVEQGAASALLIGFSMGGAVSIAAADHEAVAALLGLAPWIPGAPAGRHRARQAVRRGARRLGSPPSGHPGRQRAALTRRIRACARRGCNRYLPADPTRSARVRGTRPVREARPPAALAIVGSAYRRRGRALRELREPGGVLNLYELAFPWLPGVFRAAYRMEVVGGELVPRRGGLVVVANHLSALDPFVLGAAVPRPLRFMSKEELWRWRPVGWGVEAMGGFPVGRGRGDRSAIDTGVRLVEEGEAVAIFPGGTVRYDGPWFRGAAKIALHAGVPVLPVRLFDSDRALAGRRVRFPPLHVAIGAPIPVERARPTIASARELTERMRDAVEAL